MNSTHNPVWQVEASDFPTQGTDQEKIEFWLRYAILAPSAHNTQPWRTEVESSQLSLYRDPEHSLKESDPTSRETFLGLGAFIENLVVAAEYFGYASDVSYCAKTVHDDLAAQISFSPDAAKSQPIELLFDGITRRHTNRGFYESEPIEPAVYHQLEVPSELGTSTHFITKPESRATIAQLVGRGTAIALGMPTMEKELGHLVWPQAEPQPSGMMIEALVENSQPTKTGLDWVKEELNPRQQGDYWQQTFASSPLHIVVASELDNPAAWLASGRVMERILLAAANAGLMHCIAAAPVEIPTLLPSLRQLINGDDRPQALFRVGVPLNPDFTKLSTRRTT